MSDNMMQSSNQSVTTTTQGKEPWAAAQPAMKKGLEDALSLYNNKSGFNPFPKSLVSARSAKTTEGMGGIENSANAFGADLAKPLGFNTGVLNSGGWNVPQIDAMDSMASRAGGGGFNSFSGQGVSNLSDLNQRMMNTSGLSNYQQLAAGGFMGLRQNGGLTGGQANAGNIFGQIGGGTGLTGEHQAALSGFRDLASDGGFNAPQQASLGQIGDVASGGQMQNNPYLERMIDDASEDIREATNRQAMAMGRYGSGTHQDVMDNNIEEMSNRLRFADYNNQLGRMDNAIQNQFGMGQQGIGNQANAYNAMTGIGQAGMGNRFNALNAGAAIDQTGIGNQFNAFGSIGGLGQSGVVNMANTSDALFGAGNAGYGNQGAAIDRLFGAGQQGIANQAAAGDQMAASYNLMQQPYRDLMGVGQMEEDLAALQLQDELRVHQEAQAEPWDRLLALQGIAGGAGRVGGSMSQSVTARQPGVSPFQAMVGGGLQAYDQGMNPFMGALAGWGGLPAT